MTIVPWSCGQLLVWDATCPDTLAMSYRGQATTAAGKVAKCFLPTCPRNSLLIDFHAIISWNVRAYTHSTPNAEAGSGNLSSCDSKLESQRKKHFLETRSLLSEPGSYTRLRLQKCQEDISALNVQLSGIVGEILPSKGGDKSTLMDNATSIKRDLSNQDFEVRRLAYESVIATTRFRRWVHVSSNLESTVWKSLVICSCVGLKFERAFSLCSSPALKHSSLEQNAFVPRTKSVHLLHNKHVRLLLGRLFRKPPKQNRIQGKKFLSNFI